MPTVLKQDVDVKGLALQARVKGDGVNDAPALKKPDAGIAVSGATNAARAASDIVLLSPGRSVIIDAIKESRKIFQRMHSYAVYRDKRPCDISGGGLQDVLMFRVPP